MNSGRPVLELRADRWAVLGPHRPRHCCAWPRFQPTALNLFGLSNIGVVTIDGSRPQAPDARRRWKAQHESPLAHRRPPPLLAPGRTGEPCDDEAARDHMLRCADHALQERRGRRGALRPLRASADAAVAGFGWTGGHHLSLPRLPLPGRRHRLLSDDQIAPVQGAGVRDAHAARRGLGALARRGPCRLARSRCRQRNSSRADRRRPRLRVCGGEGYRRAPAARGGQHDRAGAHRRRPQEARFRDRRLRHGRDAVPATTRNA